MMTQQYLQPLDNNFEDYLLLGQQDNETSNVHKRWEKFKKVKLKHDVQKQHIRDKTEINKEISGIRRGGKGGSKTGKNENVRSILNKTKRKL